MNKINTVLSDAVTGSDVPFVVAMVGNRTGVTYSGAVGEAADGRAAGSSMKPMKEPSMPPGAMGLDGIIFHRSESR